MYCVPCALLGDEAGFPPSVEKWRGLVSRYAGDIPVDFLLAWIQRESGGNPCSYTTLRESGIFQLMPPDNTNQGGTTEAALRAACSGSSQSAARQLTSDELDEQVKSGIRYVNYLRGKAHGKLVAAGVTWDESNPDFWRIVKLQHAYPAPTAGWLATAAARLGRPPASWAEMRAANPTARADVLDNAEWVGGFGVGGGAASPLKFMILLGGIGVLAALAYRHSRH